MLRAVPGELPVQGLSEESKRILVVRHKYILGVAIMTQHHLVVLTPDAGFLVAAK